MKQENKLHPFKALILAKFKTGFNVFLDNMTNIPRCDDVLHVGRGFSKLPKFCYLFDGGFVITGEKKLCKFSLLILEYRSSKL